MRLMVIGGAALAVAVVVACWWAVGTTMYQAIAIISIDTTTPAGDALPADQARAAFDNELAFVRGIGERMLGAGQTFRVIPVPKTHLVEVAVIGPDPAAAALRCNLIVDACKSSVEDRKPTGAPSVRVQVINMADVPKSPYRSWRQLLPWHWGH